jgi:hypothetical protein
MSGTFLSTSVFRPEQRYVGVTMQQGRVALDADAREGESPDHASAAEARVPGAPLFHTTPTVEAPAWTQANESDPGLSLSELSAWLGESVAYRVQQGFEHFVPHPVIGTGVASGPAVGSGHAGVALKVASREAASPVARTLSSDPQLKYVDLRRYCAYLNESISKGIQFAVFAPNGEALWQNVRAAVSDFLFNEWQSGRLQGVRPEEAYFVKCDRSTMTQDDLDHGRLVILVGVATVKPGEFVILRISAMTATAGS